MHSFQDYKFATFATIRGLISPARAKLLASEFKKTKNKDDDTVPGSPAAYNYLPFLELLCELTPTISQAAGETVLPTYAYARHYKKGAILHPHKDRPACDISVTLNLSGGVGWPIFMDGVPIELGPGDGALYRGCIVEHWRDRYEGKSCVQVFLHYVRSRGEFADHYFDRINGQSRNNRSILLS